MEKKRKEASKKTLKKAAISHFEDDIRYYAKEAQEDRENIKKIKKSKKIPKNRLIHHLKGDSKGFRNEIKGDTALIKKLKVKRNAKKMD